MILPGSSVTFLCSAFSATSVRSANIRCTVLGTKTAPSGRRWARSPETVLIAICAFSSSWPWPSCACRFARAHKHRKTATRAAALRPPRSAMAVEQRPDERAAQHEKNRNHADMPVRSRIALCCALRRPGRGLNRQRQNVGGVSRRDRENQVRASALGEPRRCHAGMCRRRPPQPLRAHQGIRLQSLRRSPARWWRTGRDKSRDFRRGQSQRSRTRWKSASPRGSAPAETGGCSSWSWPSWAEAGAIAAHRTAVTARARRARPKWESILVVLQSELPSLAGSTRHASQTQCSVGFR